MMRPRFTTPLVIASLLFPVAARAQGAFSQVDLLSDVTGEALNSTAAIVNPWGLVRTSDGGFWMAINGTANALAVAADGTVQRMVAVPTAAGLGPTGIVMNSDVNAFRIEKDGVSGAARVIVSGLDGTLSGWNPDVDPDNFIQASHDDG